MDFDFSPGQLAFVDEVERFLDENDDPDEQDGAPDPQPPPCVRFGRKRRRFA